MALNRFHFLLQRGRIVLLWLLAVVVPLQCGAAVVRVVAGPMHSHSAGSGSADASPLLQDFRRLAPSRPAHAHVLGERHRHEPGDATVVAGDDVFERTSADDDDGTASAGAAFAALLPLAPSPSCWPDGTATEARGDLARWWASSRSGSRLERPPKPVQV